MASEAALAASRERARETAERVGHLQRAVTALAGALTEQRVLQIVVSTGRALGASSVTVGFLEPGREGTVLRFREVLSQLAPARDTLSVIGLDSDVPAAVAARSGDPFFISSADEVRRILDNDRTRRLLAADGEQAWALVPLLAHGQTLGVLRCGWVAERTFPEDERAALLLLAGQCAAAIDRARLLERQRAASSALEYSELRYRTLITAIALDVFSADSGGGFVTDMPQWRRITGRATSTTGLAWLADLHPEDRDRVAERWAAAVRARAPFVAEMRVLAADGSERVILLRAAPVVGAADGGAVTEWVGTSEDITEQRATARRAVALQRVTAALARAMTVGHVVTAATEVVREPLGVITAAVVLSQESAPVLDVHAAYGWTGPMRLPVDTSSLAGRAVATGQPVFAVAGEGPVSPAADASPACTWAALPLASAGAPFGALVLGFAATERLPLSQRDFLLAFAAQCALALERARLFARQRSTAQLLQRALLPERLPEVPGLEIAARYQAAGDSDVGGDWYDVVDLERDGVAVVLGDVVGRGVPAASFMGQVRTAVRAYVAQDSSPGHVLDGLDRLFATFGADELVTMFYGRIAPDGSVTYACPGHLPPFLVESDGSVSRLDRAAGPPLGIGSGARRVAATALPPGALLCVYSDGVVEHRTRSIDDGMAALQDLLEHAAARRELTLEQLADLVLSRMARAQRGDDDASLLLLRTPLLLS